jgi:hypothetical protein
VAQRLYKQATTVSSGDAYPLLNELKLQGRIEGRLPLESPRTRVFLNKAESVRRAQAEMSPPMDMPWAAFDLAEIALYRGREDEFQAWLDRGLEACNASWQPATFRKSLELLKRGGVALNGLEEGLAKLADAETWFSG